MNSRDRYISIFEKVFGANPDELNADYTVTNVKNWDSMSHILLINELEDTFDLMMDSDDIIEFDSFEKGIEILKKYEVEI